MIIRGWGSRAFALLTGSVLALSACATSAGSTGSPSSATSGRSVTSGKTFTWAYDQEFSAYNLNTPDGNQAANAVVLNGVLPTFWQFAPDGSIRRNTNYGTYTKTSDKPLTVKYTINPQAVWSDGSPIGCDDMALTWLARSGATGTKGFQSTSSAGYEDMTAPQCKAGDKTVTIVYEKPFADWDSMFGTGEIVPAHVVEKQGGLSKTFIDYARTPSSPELAKAIAFYNAGWQLTPGQLKKDLTPSSGPYLLESWAAGQSLTLKANPRWWGTPPKTGSIVIRFISGSAQVQALANGEIQAMDPQPQADIISQLKQLGDKVTFSTADQFTFEHLDFSFKGQFADKSLRTAFAKCVPRQQIVDNLIKPQNPDAQVLQSRYVFPFQPTYTQFAVGVGGQRYDTVDIAGAKTLLAGRTPTVRIGWRKDPAQLNKRRADTIALIRASCTKAGFKVVDAGTPTFFEKEWPAANFDVAMFAWSGSPVVTSSSGTYITGGGNNPYGHSNKQVDALTSQLSGTLDKTKQLALIKQIDTQLWTDLATIPLFTFPAVVATAKNVQGVTYNASQADLTWNIQDWALS